MELIIKKIYGKTITYSDVYAPCGYCFYDKDEEHRSYMERVTSPIIDEQLLREKYIIVQGNAEKLNEELTNDKND